MYSSEPRYRALSLLPFLLISVLMHVVLLLLLPDLTRLFNFHLNPFALIHDQEIEVDLVRPEPEPPPSPPDSFPQLLTEAHVASLIDRQLRQPALGESLLPSRTPVKLPKLEPVKQLESEPLPLPQTAVLPPPERLGGLGRLLAGRLSGSRIWGDPDEVAGEKLQSGPAQLLSAEARRKLLRVEKVEPRALVDDYALSGPVASSRQVLFRPALPKISLARDVTIGFRFWVRPDGGVSRVETLKIGDLELVNVAERFLKQWRFSTIAEDAPQVEQWGTVNIVFRVPR
ncbi:MAG TPA: hypothetical protein ENN66_09545 [Proteobacteria bacterium]|nr:hypothetical protein [Pseudomonadota bacterium]